jgi:hypothetical protein
MPWQAEKRVWLRQLPDPGKPLILLVKDRL